MTESKPYTDGQLTREVFSSPRVLAAAIGLPGLIGSLLRWRGSSVRLLAALVALLGGQTDARRRVTLEIGNVELSAYLWPDLLTAESAKNKVGRWLRAFEEDQNLSRALLVRRVAGRMVERDGKKEFLLSRYSVQDFDFLAGVIGERLSGAERLGVKRIRSEVGQALLDFGAVPILPEMRNEEKQRQAEQKVKAKTRKQIERAKRGEIELDYQSILALPRNDRIEVLCGQFLMWGEFLLDEVIDVDTPEELKWIVEGMQRRFASSVAVTLEKRYAAERAKIVNRSGLKKVA